MAKIFIGKERDMLFNLKALEEINNKFGSLEKMQEEISDDTDQIKLIGLMAWLIALLINQAILEKNMDIDEGLIQGEKENCISEEYVKVKLRPGKLLQFKDAIYQTITEDSEFETDTEQEVDIDLQEIEAEKNA